MDEDRMDLTPLGGLEPVRAEALVARIHEAALPELSRRAAGGGVLAMLGSWAWPTLAAASLAALAAATALFSASPMRTDMTELAIAGPVVEALEVAEPVALWLDGNRGPTTADLVMALEGDGR